MPKRISTWLLLEFALAGGAALAQSAAQLTAPSS